MLRWGLIGAGRAGKARAKAISRDDRSRLIGAFGGDPAALGVPAMPSLEVLFDSVDAVAICTPDNTHASLVRAALDAGKHALCEFPLASSRAEAQALFDLAANRNRVLHVEHIELLTSTHLVFADRLVGASVLGGHCRFTGPPREGLISVAHANVARLHRLVDAIGLPERVSAEGLHYGLATIEVDFRLGEGLERSTDLLVRTDTGTVALRDGEVLLDGEVCGLNEQPGLFDSDQKYATARILDGGGSYVRDARVLAVLDLADQLSST